MIPRFRDTSTLTHIRHIHRNSFKLVRTEYSEERQYKYIRKPYAHTRTARPKPRTPPTTQETRRCWLPHHKINQYTHRTWLLTHHKRDADTASTVSPLVSMTSDRAPTFNSIRNKLCTKKADKKPAYKRITIFSLPTTTTQTREPQKGTKETTELPTMQR